MKKALSLVLAVMMLFGCMSVTAFAEETDNSTDITLTVAKSLTYDMVIPEDVTNLNAAGIYSVGQAKVENVENATDNTVISYTASTTAFKCEGKNDIPASYYTDLQGTNTFPTTAVEVYKSKADAASIPTMYVGISADAWNAAENGIYTATVTFNFEAEEKEPECEVNLNTYTELYKVVKIDDAKVYTATYTYESNSFVLNSYSLADLPKDTFESVFGTTYAVGDCYHTDGQTLEKCALPESHGLSSNEIVFTYKNAANVQAPVTPYAVPEGTTYEIRDNQLYISCSDNPISNPYGGKQYTFTLNGVPLSNGATDTISDGDAFVGTEKVTIADILPDNFPTSSEASTWTNNDNKLYAVSGCLYARAAGGYSVSVNTGTELTFNDGKYSCSVLGATFTFFVDYNKFFLVTISDCMGNKEVLNGNYAQVK